MDLQLCLDRVLPLVKDTGSFIRKEAAVFDSSSIEYKGLNDLVSYVDKTAEAMLVEGLSEILPEAGFMAEEGTSVKRSDTYTWIIDPLDGTTNFIHGIPTFAISVALQHKGEIVLGCIYEINRNELFHAVKDGGTFLNGKKVFVSKNKQITNSLLATGFPYYDFKKQEPYMHAFKELMQICHGLRRIGSAAVDLAYVACGRFDAFFEYNLNAWDVAAGIILVKEAGGEVTNFGGGEEVMLEREILATNGLIGHEVIGVLKKYFK